MLPIFRESCARQLEDPEFSPVRQFQVILREDDFRGCDAELEEGVLGCSMRPNHAGDKSSGLFLEIRDVVLSFSK